MKEIYESRNWPELSDKISKIAKYNTTYAGNIFEVFCCYILLYLPYFINRKFKVMLYKSMSNDYKDQLNMPHNDEGIDIILVNDTVMNDEDQKPHREIIPVQCKFKSDIESCVPYSKLSTFIVTSEDLCGKKETILMSNTINPHKCITKRSYITTIMNDFFESITQEEFDMIKEKARKNEFDHNVETKIDIYPENQMVELKANKIKLLIENHENLETKEIVVGIKTQSKQYNDKIILYFMNNMSYYSLFYCCYTKNMDIFNCIGMHDYQYMFDWLDAQGNNWLHIACKLKFDDIIRKFYNHRLVYDIYNHDNWLKRHYEESINNNNEKPIDNASGKIKVYFKKAGNFANEYSQIANFNDYYIAVNNIELP